MSSLADQAHGPGQERGASHDSAGGPAERQGLGAPASGRRVCASSRAPCAARRRAWPPRQERVRVQQVAEAPRVSPARVEVDAASRWQRAPEEAGATLPTTISGVPCHRAAGHRAARGNSNATPRTMRATRIRKKRQVEASEEGGVPLGEGGEGRPRTVASRRTSVAYPGAGPMLAISDRRSSSLRPTARSMPARSRSPPEDRRRSRGTTMSATRASRGGRVHGWPRSANDPWRPHHRPKNSSASNSTSRGRGTAGPCSSPAGTPYATVNPTFLQRHGPHAHGGRRPGR